MLKWQGKSKQRLTVVKDNQQSYLLNVLKGYASEMDDENTVNALKCYASEMDDENTVNTFSDSKANEGKLMY